MEESDVRAIVRLLGDPRLFHQDPECRRRILLANLCRLVGGDKWSYSFQSRDEVSLEESDDAIPQLPAKATSREGASGELHLHASQIADGTVSRIRLSRAPGRRPFSGRERKIAQIVLTETAWLHEPVPTRPKPAATLSPRQRATLVYLAEGLSRGEIAERLRLSRHTVDDYVKAIYRRYRVNSRAMLIKGLSSMAGEVAVT
jgi:DNA-binding CsgD family transcriptional regulator